MGIFRDLVGNYFNTRMEEQREKAQQQIQMGELLKSIIADDRADPQKRALAQTTYLQLLGKHGGKKGQEAVPQIAGMMSAADAWKAMQKLSGGMQLQGRDASDPSQLPLSTGGAADLFRAPGARGVQPEGRGGFRPVLSALAGVGRDIAGRPREQPSLYSQLPPGLQGPW